MRSELNTLLVDRFFGGLVGGIKKFPKSALGWQNVIHICRNWKRKKKECNILKRHILNPVQVVFADSGLFEKHTLYVVPFMLSIYLETLGLDV